MKSLTKWVPVVLACSAITGCATILNEETQPVNISASNGKPIEGTIAGTPFTAPGIVNVKRAQDGQIAKVSTPGCTPETAIPASVDSKFFINILTGGTFGSTTDMSTEEMWKYQDAVTISCQ